MQAELFTGIGGGAAGIEWPATGQQADGETLEPIEPAIEPARGRRDALMGEERQAVAIANA